MRLVPNAVEGSGIGADERRDNEGEGDEGENDEGNGNDTRPEEILARRLGRPVGGIRLLCYRIKFGGELDLNHRYM